MSTPYFALPALAGAALLFCLGTAQAALTAYTTQASFLSAVAAPGLDTFDDFPFAAQTLGPINRNAGNFSYTATADRNGFWGAGTMDDPALSTTYSAAPIVLSGFAPSVNAVGANFYGTDLDGLFTTGDLVLIATDSTGASLTRTLTPSSTASFLGFTTTGRITALVITSVPLDPLDPESGAFPTLDNLVLSAPPAPAPEPGTLALMVAGLLTIGAAARRRQRRG